MNGHPTPPQLEPQGFFTGIRPLAVAIGALVDNLATLVLSAVVLGLIGSAYRNGAGELDEQALEALAREPGVLLASILLGSFCTGLGGLVAARSAGRHAARHGAFVGLVGVAVGLLAYASAPSAAPNPLWYDLLGFGLLVPAGALGGLASGLLRAPDDRGSSSGGAAS